MKLSIEDVVIMIIPDLFLTKVL